MGKSLWTLEDAPSQNGKLVVVTGATGGLGYETALGFAQKGATVIIIGRSDAKGKTAIEKINAAVPNAKVSFENVDLASLASVENFGKKFNAQHDVLDILINNAAVYALPEKNLTKDGFELQFATNHFCHFALTAHVLPALKRSVQPRVVNVSSVAHKFGKIDFENLQAEKNYSPLATYGHTKLANLLFTLELQKQSDAGNWGLLCTSAHPGIARTDMLANGPSENSILGRIYLWFIYPFFSHSVAQGALSILYAAIATHTSKNGYYGPDGYFETYGSPSNAYVAPSGKNEKVARQLWDVSTQLTKVKWN